MFFQLFIQTNIFAHSHENRLIKISDGNTPFGFRRFIYIRYTESFCAYEYVTIRGYGIYGIIYTLTLFYLYFLCFVLCTV